MSILPSPSVAAKSILRHRNNMVIANVSFDNATTMIVVLALPAVARARSVHWVDGWFLAQPFDEYLENFIYCDFFFFSGFNIKHILPFFRQRIRVNQPCHYQSSGSMLRLLLVHTVQTFPFLFCIVPIFRKNSFPIC